MQDYIISIGREVGSGGRRIAELLAEESKHMRYNSGRTEPFITRKWESPTHSWTEKDIRW